MSDEPFNISNGLVHLGRGKKSAGRPVNLPISQGSTLLFDTLDEFQSARSNRYDRGRLYYGRYGHDATFELEAMIAALEGAAGCISVSCGLTAVTLALSTVAESGAHILVADNIYDPSKNFCNSVLKRFGVEVEYFDPMMGSELATLMRDNTRAVYFEAPGSGTFEIPDIPAIAKVARAHGAISIIDGTWATPVFCQPLGLGVDVVVHSGSKYLNGHSDGMIGFIVCNEAMYEPMRKTVMAFGDRSAGLDIFLTLRGLRTLEMRMQAAERAGMEIAGWLQDQPQVQNILHPAFDTCPGHENWKRDFTGASGLFSIVVKECSDAQLHAFVDALDLFGVGVSWGGYESLVLPVTPARTTPQWTQPGRVIRFSIGMESLDSLKANLAAALPHLD